MIIVKDLVFSPTPTTTIISTTTISVTPTTQPPTVATGDASLNDELSNNESKTVCKSCKGKYCTNEGEKYSL